MQHCVSCQLQRENHQEPMCCLCHKISNKLAIIGSLAVYYSFIDLNHDQYAHFVCIKALASYLFLEKDDQFIIGATKDPKPSRNSNAKAKTNNQQMFILEFIKYFCTKLNAIDISVPLLFVTFKEFLQKHPVPNPFSGIEKCCFCNKNKDLLIKCQHPGCSIFCHLDCYLLKSNYSACQFFSDGCSISILFFCLEHKTDVSEINKEPSRKRLCNSAFSLFDHSSHVSIPSVSSDTLSHATSGLMQLHSTKIFLYKRYSCLPDSIRATVELFPYQKGALRFTKKKLERISSTQNVVISERKMKLLCAICGTHLKEEIFPRLRSSVLTCETCSIQIHAFCEYTNDKKWKCVHCEDPNAVCKFCGQGKGFLTRLPSESSCIICHYGCALINEDVLPRDDSLICDMCGKNRYVLKCCHNDCRKASHAYCASELFFVTPSHHFLYLCRKHILDVYSYFCTSFSTTESPLFKPFCNLRHCFSLGTAHIYNNMESHNRLYEIFSSEGMHNPTHKKINCKKELENDFRKIKGEENELQVKKESLVCLFELSCRKLYQQESDTIYDTQFLWKYVSVYCDLKKRDIDYFFRMDSKNVRFAA